MPRPVASYTPGVAAQGRLCTHGVYSAYVSTTSVPVQVGGCARTRHRVIKNPPVSRRIVTVATRVVVEVPSRARTVVNRCSSGAGSRPLKHRHRPRRVACTRPRDCERTGQCGCGRRRWCWCRRWSRRRLRCNAVVMICHTYSGTARHRSIAIPLETDEASCTLAVVVAIPLALAQRNMFGWTGSKVCQSVGRLL